MGFEYKFTLKAEVTSDDNLLLLAEELIFFHDEYMIFLIEKSEIEYVYTIKLNSAESNSMIDGGLIRLRPEEIYVLFHFGTNNQKQLVLKKLEREFGNSGFEVEFEEL